jgi:hypothetical protein
VDQSPQCQAHCIVEIAIDKAAVTELQPSNHTFKIDAALLRRQAIGGVPDGPKLRIRQREHVAMVWRGWRMSTAPVLLLLLRGKWAPTSEPDRRPRNRPPERSIG